MCIVFRVAGTITCDVWYESETGQTGVTLILCRKMLYCINTWEISIIFNVGLSVKYLPVLLRHSFSGSCCIYMNYGTKSESYLFLVCISRICDVCVVGDNTNTVIVWCVVGIYIQLMLLTSNKGLQHKHSQTINL
jgi:hypothetical protein